MSDLIQRDAKRSWHPYTQHGNEDEPLPVSAAKGASLFLEDGTELIDAISSWWAILHGHAEPVLIEAASKQLRTLDHVLFAGTTHEPAVRLAERICEHAPGPFTRAFFSDDGSTAVEVALKIVLQRWAQIGQPNRRVFVTLEGGYHGDTFGAMSVGDPDPFFLPYQPLLFESKRVAPTPGSVAKALAELGQRAAGVLVEPLLQGAAGMCVYSAEWLRETRAACDAAGVQLIADEVMTGFGRTGELFACALAGVEPDLICLAKGLTGGVFPLSATLATEELFEAFHSTDRRRAFFHGHTFTAHPVGCAIALASLDLCEQRGTPRLLSAIGERIHRHLEPLAGHESVRNLRHLGGMVAMELDPGPESQDGYLASLGPRIRRMSLTRGVLLRPLGNVVYALPPACTTDAEADRIAEAMAACVDLAASQV